MIKKKLSSVDSDTYIFALFSMFGYIVRRQKQGLLSEVDGKILHIWIVFISLR